MQCKKCGETFKLYDCYCRKCGEKRELLTYGPAHESELDFAFHSEYYSYAGQSVVNACYGYGSPRISMEFCEYNGFIYALKKRAVVKIDSKGNHTWIRLENGEDDTFHPNAIFVNSQGIIIRSGETEFFLYDETGKLLKRNNFTYKDGKYTDCYIFRDKVYIMYVRNYTSNTTPFVVEYSMINDTMRTVLDFDSFWDEILEHFRLEESQKRMEGKSFRDEPIPDSNDISYVNRYYARPQRFGVNSRRLVAVFEVTIDSYCYGCDNTKLLLDVNLNDLSVVLLADNEKDEIPFLDMSTETFWARLRSKDRMYIYQYPLNQYQKLDSILPMNQWPNFGSSSARYMDGKNLYYGEKYSFASVEKDKTVTHWSEDSHRDAPLLTVLGEFLYECHGNLECVRTWDFYYKKNTPELAFSISLDDLEKEYENPDLCVAPEEPAPVVSTVQADQSQPVDEPTQVEVSEQEEMPLIKFCMSCGAKVVPGAKFCYECGAELKLKF